MISDDIIDTNQLFSQNNSEIKIINPFNWEKKFQNVFYKGGFDCVIGNPPWVFTKYVDWGEKSKKYIDKTYLNTNESISEGKARQSGKINLYSVFIIKSIKVLKKDGLFSFIIPNTILRTTTYDIIRKAILKLTKILEIVDLKESVFEGVTASTVILTFTKNDDDKINNMINIIDQPSGDTIIKKTTSQVSQNSFLLNTSYAFDIFTDDKTNTIIKKFVQNSVLLGDVVSVFNGVATGPNKSGLHDQCINKNCKKLLMGRDIKDYFHEWNNHWIEYDPKILHRARNESIFLSDEKLIMQRIGGILITSYDNEQYYTFNSVNNLLLKDSKYSLKYILACLNSKALRFYYIKKYTNKSNLTVNISKTFLDSLPIPCVEESNKKVVEEIIQAVETLLILNKNILNIKSERDYEFEINKKEMLLKNINDNIYHLYNLKDEDIHDIENS